MTLSREVLYHRSNRAYVPILVQKNGNRVMEKSKFTGFHEGEDVGEYRIPR